MKLALYVSISTPQLTDFYEFEVIKIGKFTKFDSINKFIRSLDKFRLRTIQKNEEISEQE